MAYKGTVTSIIGLLKDNFGTGYFKAYFDGDPVLIGQSSLPAISVSKQTSAYDLGPTQFDEVTESIIIKVILNKKDDFGANPETDMSEKKLRTLCEGRDDNGALLAESVVGTLRTKFTQVSDLTLLQQLSVDYGVVPRPDDVITAEAHITVNVTGLQQVPNRL